MGLWSEYLKHGPTKTSLKWLKITNVTANFKKFSLFCNILQNVEILVGGNYGLDAIAS